MAQELEDTQQWFTVHECVGIPGFPTGVSNVRNKLEKLADGLDNVRRRREGSKAIEYHYSILPEMSRRYLGMELPIPERSENDAVVHDNCKKLWELIYSSMTQDQREAVVDVFVTGGLKQLMPDVIELSNLESAERKEILLQRNSVDKPTAAPSVSTHGKKAG